MFNYSYWTTVTAWNWVRVLKKTIFVSETLEEFFKGVSNGPQNLNEFGKELHFASVDGSFSSQSSAEANGISQSPT